MKNSKIKKFLVEEDGQTVVEYMLIIAVIIVVTSVIGKGLIKSLLSSN